MTGFKEERNVQSMARARFSKTLKTLKMTNFIEISQPIESPSPRFSILFACQRYFSGISSWVLIRVTWNFNTVIKLKFNYVKSWLKLSLKWQKLTTIAFHWGLWFNILFSYLVAKLLMWTVTHNHGTRINLLLNKINLYLKPLFNLMHKYWLIVVLAQYKT